MGDATRQPLVSVIVPVYNSAITLQRCFDSLSAQDYEYFEVVIVDDGSDEETRQRVSKQADKDRRFRVVNQTHTGRACARNRGLAHASGEWIAFVDADDYVSQQYLSAQVNTALKTGADLVVCEYISVDASSEKELYHYFEGDAVQYGYSLRENPQLLLEMGASVCNRLFSRRLFLDSGIQFPAGQDFEDLATTYRLALEAHRIEKVEQVLYYYRQNGPQSVMAACDERYGDIIDALSITESYFVNQEAGTILLKKLGTLSYLHLLVGRLDDFFTFAPARLRRSFIAAAFSFLDSHFPRWQYYDDIQTICPKLSKRFITTHKFFLALFCNILHVRKHNHL